MLRKERFVQSSRKKMSGCSLAAITWRRAWIFTGLYGTCRLNLGIDPEAVCAISRRTAGTPSQTG